MISVTKPREFVPSGRKIIQRHPDFNVSSSCEKDSVTNRFKKIDLNDSIIHKTEQWFLRETFLTFESNRNLSLDDIVDSNPHPMDPFDSESSVKAQTRKYELNTNRKIMNNFMNYEEELYIRKNILIWSKGSSSTIPDNIHNNSRVLISSFTTQNDIKQVIWCNFFLTKPNLEQTQQSVPNEVKIIPSICMIDYSTIDYCNNLYVFSASYEDFQFSLKFRVSKIFSIKFGILLIRDFSNNNSGGGGSGSGSSNGGGGTNSNTKYLKRNESLVCSLVHPLDNLSSVVIIDDNCIEIFRDSSLQILFTSSSPSIALIYNKKSNLHSIFLIRKLNDVEKKDFLKGSQSFNDASASQKLSSRLDSPIAVNESNNDIQNLLLSNLSKSKLTSKALSSPINLSQTSILSPNTKLNKSKQNQSFKATDSHMDIDFGESIENKLNVDLCFERLWTETSANDLFNDSCTSMASRAATKVFVSIDIMKEMFLCYLCSSENLLYLVHFSQLSERNFEFKQKTELVAKDAIQIPKLCMIAVLDMTNQINLYTGTVYVGRIQLDTSFQIDLSKVSSHFKKQKPYIERFQNDRLFGFKECVNRKLILEYEDEDFCQIEIPPFFTSNLIERTLCSLKNVLTRNNALLLITQWYRKRNSPGLKEFSLKEEWELFEVVLMSALGYRVEICNEYDEGPIQAKKSKPSEQENKVWCSFLDSAHHTLIGEQVLNMLHLKQVRNRNWKRSAGVVFNYDCDNNEAALLLEFKTIFYSLHLLYEDLKLNHVFSDQLIYLATFLDKLSNDFSLNLYVSYYRNDFPSIIDQNNAKNRQLVSNMNICDAVFNNTEPPNIMHYLYQLLNDEQVPVFPYVKSVNPRCKHLIQIYMLILNRLTHLTNQNNSIIDNVVEYMTSVGITNEVLESFPVGVSLPIYEILWQCRNNPPPNWSSQAYSLIYREDLQAQADVDNELNVDEENYKYSDKNVKVDCNEDDSALEKRDGMEDIENSALKYQFTDDKRVAEVRKMLQSCGQVRIAIKQKPETSDHEFVEEQEKHLFTVCARTMSLPVGRGIFTLRTVKPVITETFPIPKLCLHGKSYPLGTAIDLSHIEIHSNMNMWSLFHNGVASGLRISHNASNINSTWILFNRPKSIGESATEHAGFLMALGLNGHLQNLNSLSLYEYLIKFNKLTSIGLLLGLSASKIGTMDNFVTKILSIHIDSLLPPTSIELDIPQDVQIASILGIGLLYQGTSHRYMSEIMLNEIKRSPGPEMEHANDRDSYALTAGLALGMIALKHGSRSPFNDDLKLFDQLYVYIFGGRRNIFKERQKEKSKNSSFLIREGNNINTNITAPGALMALALIYLDSNNENLASILKVPETQPLLECVRPDLLMLRTLAKDLIMWGKIEPKVEWVEKHIPEFMKPYCLKKVSHEEDRSLYYSDINYETMNQAFCNVVVGACFALGLRYAGTKNHDAFTVLKHYCKVFLNLSKKTLAELVGKATIETCLNVVLVSMGLVMAGSGNVEILRVCRFLRSRVGTNTNTSLNYGSHMAVHMTAALLFMGGGRYSLSNSPSAVAALLCAFFPKYPSHSNDNRYHLQAFRHFYVLAAEPRLFITKSIVTNDICFANIRIVMMNETELQCRAPCLLPPTDLIKKIQVDDRNLLQIIFERDRNWNQLLDILSKNKFVCVKNKAKPFCRDDSLLALTKNSPTLPHFFYDALKESFIHDSHYGLCIQNFVKCSQSLSDSNHFMKYLSIALHDSMNKDSPMALKFWIFIIKNLEKNPKTLQTLGLWQFKLMYAKILNPKINNVFIPIEMAQAVRNNLNQLDPSIAQDISNLRCSSTPFEISNQRTINYLLLNDLTIKELRCPSDIIHLLKTSQFDLITKMCEM